MYGRTLPFTIVGHPLETPQRVCLLQKKKNLWLRQLYIFKYLLQFAAYSPQLQVTYMHTGTNQYMAHAHAELLSFFD
jgi:hypothetical protein